jgi:hypothetical protein
MTAGRFDQRRRTAAEKDLPVSQDRHIKASLTNVLDDVRGEDRDPVRGQIDEQIAEADALLGIQASGRLGDDEQSGFIDQCLGNTHPAIHATGGALDLTPDCVGQTDGLQYLVHAPEASLRVIHAFQTGHVIHK